MGSKHSVPKEGGERLSDYLRREFKGKGFDADTLVVIALKDEQKGKQKDKKKRKGLWKQLTGRLSSKRSADKHDTNTKGYPATQTTSGECNTQSVTKTSDSKPEPRNVETPSNNDNGVHRGSPEGKCVHLNNGETSSLSETPEATQNVEPTPSTSSHVERRYLRSGDSPVYQFNVPPKYDLRRPKSSVRSVRDMTRGTQPSWADKDYGSEFWEDNSANKPEEVSGDRASCSSDVSRNTPLRVGGWSDETAYRVRGIVEELSNLTCQLTADTNAFANCTNGGTVPSIVNDAHKTACCVRNRTKDPASSVENKSQERSENESEAPATLRKVKKEADNIDRNNIDQTAMSHEASCQTEHMVSDSICLNSIQKSEIQNNVRDKVEDKSDSTDTYSKDVNSVEVKAKDALSMTCEMTPYSVSHNDKDLAYIAGILAAGAAYSVGNATDIQKAAYLAGVRAVDAAYRMANETATSFADIRVADSTKPVKSNVEAETAAYLAGIRAVEVAHRKAEEIAYMNGIEDAKEVIRTKGQVEEPVSKVSTTDISGTLGENIEEAAMHSKTNTNKMQETYESSSIQAGMSCKESSFEQLKNNNIINEKAHENHFAIDTKEVTAPVPNHIIVEKDKATKSSVRMSENTENVYSCFEKSVLKNDTRKGDKKVIKETDIPKHEEATNQNNVKNMCDLEIFNFSERSYRDQDVNKSIGSDNGQSCHTINLYKVENSDSYNETIAKSSFGDSNTDDRNKNNTKLAATALNGKDESLFDRGEECSDNIKELERMAELLFEQYAPSVYNDKDIDGIRNDKSKSFDKDKTTKDNPKDTFEKSVKPFIDMATFDEMPIKKANSLLRQPWTEMEYASEDKSNTKRSVRKNTDKNAKMKGKTIDIKCNEESDSIQNMAQRENDKFGKNNQKQQQKHKTEGFHSQAINTKKLKADEMDNNHSTPNVMGKPFIDMATFDEMPIKKADALLRPPGKETEFAFPDQCNKPKLNKSIKKKKNGAIQTLDNAVNPLNKDGTKSMQEIKVTDSISTNISNEVKDDTCDKNNHLNKDSQKQNNAAEAFFVSFDSQTINNRDLKADKKDNLRSTPNDIGTAYIDMSTFDEMPIKKAEALLRPPGEETEYAPPGPCDKLEPKKLLKKKTDTIQICDNAIDPINKDNGTKSRQESKIVVTDSIIVNSDIKHDTVDSNDIDETNSKSGAAEAFFASLDSPTIDKAPKKCAKRDLPDTSKNMDRPFIDMATYDDMPIKKADALLRPSWEEDEYKSAENNYISRMAGSVKTKVKRLVRKKDQYGSVEHNKLIESENVMRKEKLENASTTVASFKTSDDDDNNNDIKTIRRPPKLTAKKAQYGSVAHNNQIKDSNEIQKKKLGSIKSSLDTWKAKDVEVSKKRAEYGSVAHNNQIKLDNAMRKKRMQEIHSNLDTWNDPNPGSKYSLQRKEEWEPVSDPGKFGSVAHFQQIKRNNAQRKRRMNNIRSSLNTWNKPNPGSMYSLKRKDEWTPVSDTKKYGSVAHYHQVRKKHGNNKQMIQSASSKISTWQPKSKMNLLHANNQKGTGGKNHSAQNKVSISNADLNTERGEEDFSPRQNDYRVSSWSRYGPTRRTGEYDSDEEHMSYSYPRDRTYQEYDVYPSPNNMQNLDRDEYNNESLFSYERGHQKRSKIPKLVIPDSDDTFASGRNNACKSSLAFECNYGNRYREVNPLTVDPDGQSWDTADYSHWQFQDSARSCSRPLSCRSDGSSIIPVTKTEQIDKYKGLLHGSTPHTNGLRHKFLTRWSPRGYS